LRDGGHQVGFNWPTEFMVPYLNAISRVEEIAFVEVGYWGQEGKFLGPYYSLGKQDLESRFAISEKTKLAVMIDYHYCNKDLDSYPKASDENSVGLIRVTARQDQVDDAFSFMSDLADATGIMVSCNIFNVSNYVSSDLDRVVDKALDLSVSVVAFADTHGAMDMRIEKAVWKRRIQRIHEAGKKSGIHLHDHLGLAHVNKDVSEELDLDFCDVSLKGIGKGLGNLRLEHCVDITDNDEILRLWSIYDSFMQMPAGPWGYLTACYSATDHYAEQAQHLGLNPAQLRVALESMSQSERDNYEPRLLMMQ